MEATGSNPVQSIIKISDESIGEYLTLLELRAVTEQHKKETERYLKNYKKYILSSVDKTTSLEYFKKLLKENSLAYYKRQMYQILRFLNFLKVEWVDEIKLPPDPYYEPKRITKEDISNTLEYFENDINYDRYKALIMLGSTSGMRAEELYALTVEDIELENRTVYVRHDPRNNHSTKNRKTRVTFFTNETQKALSSYTKLYTNSSKLRTLFAKKTLERAFRDAPIQVKDLRKFFSQEWDRQGGPTSIKKILMDHSLKGDVDLMHYNCQSEEDLKRIYDKFYK